MRRCTRKLEFDAAHRVMRHESKCKHLHGHRYVVELTVSAPGLDDLGRVIDFGCIKEVVGAWIDEHWDHGTLLNYEDRDLVDLCKKNEWRWHGFDGNPTAENISAVLFYKAAELLHRFEVEVQHVRVYETPNCWSDFDG